MNKNGRTVRAKESQRERHTKRTRSVQLNIGLLEAIHAEYASCMSVSLSV